MDTPTSESLDAEVNERVQREMLVVFRPYVIAVSVPTGVFFLLVEAFAHALAPTLLMGVGIIVLMGLTLQFGPSHRVRAGALTVGLTALTVVTFLHWGVALGVGLLASGATMAATFNQGRRGAAATIAVILATATVIALGSTGGWLSPTVVVPDLVGWLRVHALIALCLGGVSFSLLRVMREMRLGAVREAEARAEQRAAEGERGRALEAMMKGQRLEAAGRLASGIAHDFNNALLVLQGTIELVRMTQDEAERELLIDEGLDAIQGASATARQLLDLARPTVGETGSCEPAEVLDGLARRLRRILPKAIELGTALGPCPVVPVSSAALEQIALNLVINARDAIDGPGQIVLGCAASSVGDAELWVMDTGAGMDAATQARLFEPFFTTKGSRNGTGLGLSMVQGFMARSGGSIEVTSHLGEGTRLTLTWPAAATGPSALRPVTQTNSQEAGAEVLLVEDNADAARVISRTLVSAGYCVTVVHDLAAAQAQLDAASFDLIASAGLLSDGSALALAERIEAEPDGPGLMVFSAYFNDARVIAAAELGGRPILAKPFSPAQLLEACAQALAIRDQREPSEAQRVGPDQ